MDAAADRAGWTEKHAADQCGVHGVVAEHARRLGSLGGHIGSDSHRVVTEKHQWFIRRRLGFGVRPVAWQGWAISAVAAVLVVVSLLAFHHSGDGAIGVLVVVGLYLVIGYAAGGTRQRQPGPKDHPLEEAPKEPPRRTAGEPAVAREDLNRVERLASRDLSVDTG